MNGLSADVEIKGSLTFSNELLLEGRVEGDLFSGSTLVIGERASVKGTVSTHSVTIYGVVEGDIEAQERCEVKSTARVIGNISARRFSIEEGATFQGRSKVQNSPPPQSHGSPQGRRSPA
ncbi:MAG: bactofilin family protein [Prosthecobacter sp.]